jgi:hypothetical protein
MELATRLRTSRSSPRRGAPEVRASPWLPAIAEILLAVTATRMSLRLYQRFAFIAATPMESEHPENDGQIESVKPESYDRMQKFSSEARHLFPPQQIYQGGGE